MNCILEKVSDMTEEEENAAMLKAIQKSVNEPSATEEEVINFRTFIKE